jgi:quinol monooxygenase YgiN
MIEITPDKEVVTLINVLRVEPDRQQELVDVLVDATTGVMSKQPGYVSASIHRSLDGAVVTSYAQWRSVDDFQKIRANPEVQAHMARVAGLADFDPHLFEVVFTHQPSA